MQAFEAVHAINAAIERCGLDYTTAGPVDCVCVAREDDDAPDGWVRVYDDHARVCGDAADLAQALSDATTPDGFWESISLFPDDYPDPEADRLYSCECGQTTAMNPGHSPCIVCGGNIL